MILPARIIQFITIPQQISNFDVIETAKINFCYKFSSKQLPTMIVIISSIQASHSHD